VASDRVLVSSPDLYPPDRHEEFYEAVQTIPENVARKFSLYDVYMCCNFLQEGEESSEPEEFEILIPFLLSGFEHSLPKWKYGDDPSLHYS